MIPVNVFDLDGTLLAQDSFRTLLRRHLDLRLAALAGARLLRALDRAAFAAAASRHLAPVLGDAPAMERFADELAAALDPDVLALARRRAQEGTVTVVLSSSPEEYVVPLARRLGFDGVGSGWREGRYFHCHGQGKRAVLLDRYPPGSHRYQLAVADSASDEPLLGLFAEAIRHRRRR
jgi:phosphoserine phosphatase